MTPTKIGIGGFSSNSGKTTLLCELLRSFPGWEAIKITRGHYRSCGKDPHACCVSHMLGQEPVIRSGRETTYVRGKDTGRYWDAGASNVHWLIVTDQQVEQGIAQALERVEADGVFIEGTGFLKYLDVDFSLMAAPAAGGKIKPSARRVLPRASAVYLYEAERDGGADARGQFNSWLRASPDGDMLKDLPVYTQMDLARLVARIRAIHAEVSA